MLLDINSYSTITQLEKPAFVQLKNPITGALEFSEDGKAIGIELYSMQSNEFKRAQRSTAHLGLTKDEQKKQAEIIGWMQDGTKPSDESLDFLDACEDKITKKMQRVFALVTKKLHGIELSEENAKTLNVKVTKKNAVSETVDNIYNLYVALPDLSKQVGDAIATNQNFIKA